MRDAAAAAAFAVYRQGDVNCKLLNFVCSHSREWLGSETAQRAQQLAFNLPGSHLV